MKEVDSDIAFDYWLKGAKKGERVVYYDGFLMRDREVVVRSGFFAEDYPPKIKAAVRAWKAFQNGWVKLVQRKRDELEYEYIAVKT